MDNDHYSDMEAMREREGRADHEIDKTEARRIASEWHGGQSSALYAFSSSGTITTGLEGEIDQCIKQSSGHDDIGDLRLLRAYVSEHTPPDKPNFEAGARNDYWAIDRYLGDICINNVMAGLTEKDAHIMVGALNEAVEHGRTYESQLLRWEQEQKEGRD